MDRGIAVSFLDLGASWGRWSAASPGRCPRRKDPVPIVQEPGWTPGLVWTSAKNLAHGTGKISKFGHILLLELLDPT
jgi:hypothetical protein